MRFYGIRNKIFVVKWIGLYRGGGLNSRILRYLIQMAQITPVATFLVSPYAPSTVTHRMRATISVSFVFLQEINDQVRLTKSKQGLRCVLRRNFLFNV